MPPSDAVKNALDRRQRRLLIVLALGICVALAPLPPCFFYVLRPETSSDRGRPLW